MILKIRNNGWASPFKSPLSDFFEANEFLNNPKARNIIPAVNVFEDEEQYTIEVALPGMNREDFSVKINEGLLTISAEKSEEDEDGDIEGDYTYREYNYDSFSRSFSLPKDAVEDEISATYEDGELILIVPKASEVASGGREIEVG